MVSVVVLLPQAVLGGYRISRIVLLYPNVHDCT